MRLTLLEFQEDHLDGFVKHLRNAAQQADSDGQSISLSAPTGSGKTVIATAAIERLFFGDDDNPGDPESTVLWITDQPELNRQTLHRMQRFSDRLPLSQLVEIEEGSFDQAELEPGHVYFLNTQKLGVKSKLVHTGDKQRYTLWDTFTNTVATRGQHFFVFIDEAHRGMSETKNRQEATTIIQKFIKGSDGETPAIPLIVGLSATLDRFDKLLAGTNRVRRTVDIPASVVRESGLIKEKIILRNPPKTAAAEMTLLGVAASQLKIFHSEWDDYTSSQDLEPVLPLMVVQVEDGSGKKTSNTDLDAVIKKIESELGPLADDEIGHAFETHAPVTVGSREVRYVAPSDINEDSTLRVVFFKKSLSVGWDCPRAEVMMSFRPAKDATLIAQLIGRMVRNPLARPVGTNENLNTVAVCLPHYDKKNVDKIVSYLTDPQNGALEAGDIVDASELVSLVRAAETDDFFTALEELPSYLVPRTRSARQIERLRQLAQQLSNDGIDDDAPDTATASMIEVLDDLLKQKSENKQFSDQLSQAGSVSVEAYAWTFGESQTVATGTTSVTLDKSDLQRVFDAVGRRLGDIYKPWWRHRVEDDGVDTEKARRELIALASEPEVQANVEKAAGDLVEQWFSKHKKRITAQNDEATQNYDRIRGTSDKPTLAPLHYPDSIDVRRDDKNPPIAQHLYVDEATLFPGKLNEWERKVILAELARDGVVGWLRNEPLKPGRSFCVPYTWSGETKAMYPDFFILRRDEDGDVVVDLLDPHTTSLTDAPAKAAGLAAFARDHGDAFGRIECIIVDAKTKQLVRLDLQNSEVRKEVLKVSSTEHLEALYRLSSS